MRKRSLLSEKPSYSIIKFVSFDERFVISFLVHSSAFGTNKCFSKPCTLSILSNVIINILYFLSFYILTFFTFYSVLFSPYNNSSAASLTHSAHFKAQHAVCTPLCPVRVYRGADKSLARPGRKQAATTEEFDVHISYL